MTDAPPTTGLHHMTNSCTDMAETRAFGVEDGETFAEWKAHLDAPDVRGSGPRDRTYFTSLSITDPHGLPFELAREEPGFRGDEAELGSNVIDPCAEGYAGGF